MSLLDLILLIGGGGVLYYLFRPSKKADTFQELLDYEDITTEGVIILPDQKYRLVLEVEPINMGLRSFEEQSAIWLGFKNMVNSLNIPVTFLIQTRYLDLKNYLNALEDFNADSPKHIKGLVDNHIKYLSQRTESKQVRDRRYFVILKVDANKSTIESGVQFENQLIDMLFKSLPNKSVQGTNEVKKDAKDELMEAASIIGGALDAVEIQANQLDRKGVVEILYQTFNRDMAPFARVEEADADGMFSLFVNSETPNMILKNEPSMSA